MRHIDVVAEVFNGWGRCIFPGLRRRWSAMSFLVVRTSQIGAASKELFSSELYELFKRFFVVEAASLRSDSLLICLRRALEALSVWR